MSMPHLKLKKALTFFSLLAISNFANSNGGPTIISANDGSTVYLREFLGNVQYSLNNSDWIPNVSFPATLINTGGGTSGIDINFSSGSHSVGNNSEYFIVGSDYVNFTYNTSAIPIYNGNNATVGYRIGSIVIGNDVVYDG